MLYSFNHKTQTQLILIKSAKNLRKVFKLLTEDDIRPAASHTKSSFSDIRLKFQTIISNTADLQKYFRKQHHKVRNSPGPPDYITKT